MLTEAHSQASPMSVCSVIEDGFLYSRLHSNDLTYTYLSTKE